MTKIFWLAVAVDAALFLVLLMLGLSARGHDDGGRGMAMMFSVIIPGVIVGAAVLLFLASESPLLRVVALIVVAGPGLLVAGARVRSAAIDAQVRRNAEGSGYFSDGALSSAGSAVVRRDVAALRALRGRIDVNARGRHDMTLMELAVMQAYESTAPSGGASSLEVVQALLALGADPNIGLSGAMKLSDGAILGALLEAGASPNFSDERGPAAFMWLNVMPLASFTTLLDRGLDVDLQNRSGSPLVVEAARNDRWNFVLLLMARGASVSRADGGTRLADVVQSRLASTTTRPPEMMADVNRVKAKLDGGYTAR